MLTERLAPGSGAPGIDGTGDGDRLDDTVGVGVPVGDAVTVGCLDEVPVGLAVALGEGVAVGV